MVIPLPVRPKGPTRSVCQIAVLTMLLAACAETSAPTEVLDDPALARLAVTGLNLTMVSAGQFHTCGVEKGGRPLCWGANGAGQLGNDSQDDSDVPVVVSDLSAVTIAAGGGHTCALTKNGDAYCWGSGSSGQLGTGLNGSSRTPLAVTGGHTFVAISAGNIHTCGLKKGGEVLCWGRNFSGQLGNGENNDRNEPVPVSGGHSFVSISAGEYFNCGLTKGGQILCWGGNTQGQLGNGTSGGVENDTNVPGPIASGHTFTAVSAGLRHTCAVSKSGPTYCWGWNDNGQLGNGSIATSNIPVPVSGGYAFVSVAVGGLHSCGAVRSGQTYCWGQNEYGQLGNGGSGVLVESEPVAVASGFSFAALTAGRDHTCALSSKLGTWCWGANYFGQLGNGNAPHLNTAPSPVRDAS
jgi:alpha-tubulin suppressor-like RCC1 family protein